jgi:hypothetical protein
MVSAKWPRTERLLGCGFDIQISSKRTVAISLGNLKPVCEEYSHKRLKSELDAAFELPDNTHDILRWRTIYTLMQNETIFCINFIPKDPTVAQIIHVMRLKDKEKEVESCRVFCHDVFNLKFILPVESADQVFDLSKKTVSETVNQFDPSIGLVIERALACFSEDLRSQGLAITLEIKAEKSATYIWLKGSQNLA